MIRWSCAGGGELLLKGPVLSIIYISTASFEVILLVVDRLKLLLGSSSCAIKLLYFRTPRLIELNQEEIL